MATAKKSSSRIATIASVFMAVLFLFAGGTKLAGMQMHLDQFAHWGYPIWFMYVVGVIEVAGAVALLIPRTRFYVAVLLTCSLAGASLTLVRAGEARSLPFTALLMVSAVLIAWLNRPAAASRQSAPS
jgi:putative oxidoreductase